MSPWAMRRSPGTSSIPRSKNSPSSSRAQQADDQRTVTFGLREIEHRGQAVCAERPPGVLPGHARMLHLPADGLSAHRRGGLEEGHSRVQGAWAESHSFPLLVSAGGGVCRRGRAGVLLPGRVRRLVESRRGQGPGGLALRGKRAHRPRVWQPSLVPAADAWQ